MHPELHSWFASERLKDDHHGIEPVDDGIATLEPETITIRRVRPGDVPAVELLAALESRPVPPGPLLVAEVEGKIEAATSLREGGQTVANPSAQGGEAVSLLYVRAEQLRAA